ncbi:MAG: hypothetical protein QXQ53_08065, partial [Candidatus Methanosuratincola sp.]
EALQLGRHFVGYDLNPLAVLIARVRSTPLSREEIMSHLKTIVGEYAHAIPAFVPPFPNLRYWFDEATIEGLSRLHALIQTLADPRVRNFFQVVFSAVVRLVSLTDPSEFKLIRRKSQNTKPIVEEFQRIALDYIDRLSMLRVGGKSVILLHEGNMLEACRNLEPERFDLLLTSPPYGDSRTTVAYGQFSRLALWWLGMQETIDKSSLGSRRRPIHAALPSALLYEVLEPIAERNPKRAEEVFSFYADLYEAVQVLAPLVRVGGYAFVLVGNRRVEGIELPTDKICADFFTAQGYEHIATHLRSISNKRMPSQNSPKNAPGQTDSTMRMEYLVQLQRV